MRFRSAALPQFWKCYDRLPRRIQELADHQYALFSENPLHPSLRLKEVGPFWAVRVTRRYRALAIREGDLFTWIWVGPHDEYERIFVARAKYTSETRR